MIKKLFIFLIGCLILSQGFSLPFSSNKLYLVTNSMDSKKAENMDKIALKKKQISSFLKFYSAQHGLNLEVDIRQKGNNVIITIFKQDKNNFFTDEKSYKSISHEDFLNLDENEIKNIITKMVEDPDDFPHPGSGITP